MRALVYVAAALLLGCTGAGFGADRDDADHAEGQIELPMDERDAEALAKLSAEELKALNEKLRQAMSLYYDRAYRLALPIFGQIAGRMNTLDVLYWYGKSAYSVGDSDLAITNFTQMLARNPKLARVRLDLALAYLQKRDYASAREQVRELLALGPAEPIQKELAELDERIKRLDRRFTLSFNASLGTFYDDNVSVLPDVDRVTLPGGGFVTGTRAQRGWATVVNLAADALYDLTKQNRLFWRNRVGFYLHDYHGSREFDYHQVDARTSLERYSERWRLRVPVGFIQRDYGRERLSQSWYLEPTYERNVTENSAVIATYRFEDERYKSDLRKLQDNHTSTFSIGPSWHFGKDALRHTIAIPVSCARSSAAAEAFSYEDLTVAPSWSARSKSGWEFTLEGRYVNRKFDGAAFLFTDRRHDDRYSVSAALSKDLGKRFVVSTWYAYTRNDSNTELFSYRKTVVGVNLGINLGN